MGSRPLNLVLLLAVTIAVSSVRADWIPCHRDAENSGPVDYHEHSHNDGVHTHAHDHHQGDPVDEDSEHHDCALDNCPDEPTTFWALPGRAESDGPPPMTAGPASLVVSQVAREPLRCGEPPPRSAGPRQHSHFNRTVVLQV